jgi:hypothetical protein
MCPLFVSALDWIFRYLLLPFLLSAYAGVVVSRLYQFYDSKKDAWEAIISMEDKLHLNSGTLTHPWANARLNSPTQRLRYFGHRSAFCEVDAIAASIGNALKDAQRKLTAGVAEVAIPRTEWEQRIVAVSPSWFAIFKPWPIRF